MRTMHKHTFERNTGVHTVTMPEGAEIKHVGCQGGMTTMWYEWDTSEKKDMRVKFAIFGTGQDIPDGWNHVGTAVCTAFVWHLYTGY